MIHRPSPAETLADHRQRGSWISVRGMKVFTRITGNGPPLLCLHGFPTSSYDFTRILPLLAEKYTLILFDYPGFGLSEKPESSIYLISYFAQITQDVLAYYGFKNISVLAHDIGDSTALVLLAEAFPVISKLVLMNANIVVTPFHDKKMLFAQRLLLYTIAGKLVSKTGLVNRSFYASMLKSAFFTPLTTAEMDAFWELFRFNRGNFVYYRLIQYMKERKRKERAWLENLLKIEIPVTMIWGREDPIAPTTIPRKVLELRPNTTYVPLEKTNHYPHWESPNRTAYSVLQALDD